MPEPDLRRKTVYFLAFAAILVLVLILFPILEEWVRMYLSDRFGLVIAADGAVTVASGDLPGTMTVNTVNLVVNALHVLKIIIWMALIIATVRYVGGLILNTAYRTSESHSPSLLKTVLSIVIYVVAFFIIFQQQFPTVQLAPLFTGSTIIGIVVGLALQDTLGNLFAGLALQADQPFVVGDVITIPGRGEGVVETVSWRGVKIRTFQNKLIIVSNAQ